MINFHEHKLWQDSYVALMDIHEVLDNVEPEDHDERVVDELLDSSEAVASTIADGLTRADKHVAKDLMFEAVGLVAQTRTHLAVAWGRGLLDDDTFKGLDGKFDALSSSLQSYK
jgi:four helix bundle protein